MTKAAKVVARGAHQDVHCPDCGKLLGKIFDSRLVIKVRERYIEAAVNADVVQTCSCCGTKSGLAVQEMVK